MSQFNIQDPELRKALNFLQSQLDEIRASGVKAEQKNVVKLPVAIPGDTSGRWYQIKVSDSDRTNLSVVFSDIGG